MNAIQDIANRSEVTNTRLDKLVERIEAVELAQSMTVYPSEDRVEGLNPYLHYGSITRSSLTSITAPPAQKLDRKQMPCFQFAKQNCNKTAEQCDYSHAKDVINKYLDSHHAGVTNSKKVDHAKSKDTFKALSNSTSNRPPQIYSTPSLAQFLLVKVTVPPSHLSPTVLQFHFTTTMISHITTTIS